MALLSERRLLEMDYSAQTFVATVCLYSKQCKDAFLMAAQVAKLSHAGLRDLGDILAAALETTVAGPFHPTNVFKENRLLLERGLGTMEDM